VGGSRVGWLSCLRRRVEWIECADGGGAPTTLKIGAADAQKRGNGSESPSESSDDGVADALGSGK